MPRTGQILISMGFLLSGCLGPIVQVAEKQPSSNPSAIVSGSPTSRPASSPSQASPTAQASLSPASATPVAIPTTAASLMPSPSPSSTAAFVWDNWLNPVRGMVYDDKGQALDDVLIQAHLINHSDLPPYSVETHTQAGSYAFKAPGGVNIEIIASKTGFTTRRRVEFVKVGVGGQSYANFFQFGIDETLLKPDLYPDIREVMEQGRSYALTAKSN